MRSRRVGAERSVRISFAMANSSGVTSASWRPGNSSPRRIGIDDGAGLVHRLPSFPIRRSTARRPGEAVSVTSSGPSHVAWLWRISSSGNCAIRSSDSLGSSASRAMSSGSGPAASPASHIQPLRTPVQRHLERFGQHRQVGRFDLLDLIVLELAQLPYRDPGLVSQCGTLGSSGP